MFCVFQERALVCGPEEGEASGSAGSRPPRPLQDLPLMPKMNIAARIIALRHDVMYLL